MFTRIKNIKSVAGAALLFIMVGIFVLLTTQVTSYITVNNTTLREVDKIVIDPGHGGIDPGAIGVSGQNEKDINLAISLCLRDMLVANGYEVIMTRETDISTNDKQYKSVGKIKSSDLKNRLRLINSQSDAIAISIHQNKYPSENSSGAQMFYGIKNEQSKQLASCLQASFRELLQPDNKREIKPSTSKVYIIHNSQIPITLVECGFLSNYGDASKLSDEEYQRKVAFAIFCGIVNSKKLE